MRGFQHDRILASTALSLMLAASLGAFGQNSNELPATFNERLRPQKIPYRYCTRDGRRTSPLKKTRPKKRTAAKPLINSQRAASFLRWLRRMRTNRDGHLPDCVSE